MPRRACNSLTNGFTGCGDQICALIRARGRREIALSSWPGARQTPFVEPVRSYVICCVQRTGSWLLAHTLADTGYAGRPSDYFDDAEQENRTRQWGVTAGGLTVYVRAMRDHATTPNGVLGSKLMWNNFNSLRSSLRPPAGTDPGLGSTSGRSYVHRGAHSLRAGMDGIP